MKKCTKCNKEKSLLDFNNAKERKDGLSSWCKECVRDNGKKHYKSDPKKYLENHRKNRKIRFKWFEDIKDNSKCLKCDEKRNWLLDFHHLDPKQKTLHISTAVRKSKSEEIVKEELKKCIVLCSNCHRDFHYLEKTQKITIEQYLIKTHPKC
jgi:hypothetical protein